MSKFIDINNQKISYEESGSGKDIILMHGWGQNKEMMAYIFNYLKDSFHVISLDFPGFGESEEPKEVWGMDEYEEVFKNFLKALNIEKPILIAHSFGCRVAIRYAAHNPANVYKMCLTGAAGIKPKRGLDYQIRTKAYKAGKWFLKVTHQDAKLEELQNKSGSEDYRNATGVMRGTFVKVVNDDVTPLLKDVKCSVLLVWGENDDAVPLWMGKMMEEEMPDAGLAIFEGDDHFAYFHQADRFNRVLDAFIGDDK